MRHTALYTLALSLTLGVWATSLAAPVKIGGNPMAPAVETRRDLDEDTTSPTYTLLDERVSLVAFPRFGVVVTDTSKGFTLTRGTFVLEYALPGGWVLGGLPLPNLRDPVAAEGQLWVPVKILGWLGFKISSAAGSVLVDALPNTPSIPTSAFVVAPPKPPAAPVATSPTPPASSVPAQPAAPVSSAPAATPAPGSSAPPTAPTPTVSTPTTPVTAAPSNTTPANATPAPSPATAPAAATPSAPVTTTPPAPTAVSAAPPAQPNGKANVNKVLEARSSKGRTSRLVLDLARAVEYRFDQVGPRVRVMLKDTTVSPRLIPVGAESIGRARLLQEGADAVLDVEVAARASVKVSTLTAPDRLLVDAEIPEEKAPAPGVAPLGVTLQAIPAEQLGLGSTASSPTNTPAATNGSNGSSTNGTPPANGSSTPNRLSLVTLDPNRYVPRLVTAPWGSARTVYEHAKATGAPVAVNGGYFDPASNLPVDLIVTGGSVLAYSRGNRSTIGFLGTSLVLGIPKVRLTVQPEGNDATGVPAPINVSTVRPNPHPQWITAFIGDGFVPVGGAGFTTLVFGSANPDGSSPILERHTDAFVPASGQFTISFNPANWPALEKSPGTNVKLGLTWSDPAWNDITEALAVGPKLITAGAISVNGTLEGFDTKGEIWRPTRQAALGLDAQNQYVIAVLENGSPEDFAQALLKAGLREAVRLDSGTSAAVYVSGGMVGNKWGRTVPNAIVFMPR